MKTLWTIIIIIALIGIWYWASHRSPSLSPTASTTPSTALGLNGSPDQTNTGLPSATPVLAATSTSALGTFLVAANGMTLYKYAKDTAGVSNCTGSCATIWPPYIVGANELLMGPDDATGTIATITRPDGLAQLTYNGMPLYYYSKDLNPGDTKGQAVNKAWYVVAK